MKKKWQYRGKRFLIVFLFFIAVLTTPDIFAEPILFISTQLNPISEATAMREVILEKFPQAVEFKTFDDKALFNAYVLNIVSNPLRPVVIGGLDVDFRKLYQEGALANLDDVSATLSDRAFYPLLTEIGKLETDHTFFIPWMQATYLMVASKKALPYLPKGADLQQLTYDDLMEWAENIYQAAGIGLLGFPVGPKGLMSRFLKGYLSLSFTGTMAGGFDSQSSIAMWEYLRNLWQYVAPSSLIANRMDQVLLQDKVWVAWDHTARLVQVFRERPQDFVAFPAPVGPMGRGSILVLAGLGILKGTNIDQTDELIKYLTRMPVQVKTMENIGFLPVITYEEAINLPTGLKELYYAAMEQLLSSKTFINSQPGQVNEKYFDIAYMVAFSRIVLRGMEIQPVLESQVKILNEKN